MYESEVSRRYSSIRETTKQRLHNVFFCVFWFAMRFDKVRTDDLSSRGPYAQPDQTPSRGPDSEKSGPTGLLLYTKDLHTENTTPATSDMIC